VIVALYKIIKNPRKNLIKVQTYKNCSLKPTLNIQALSKEGAISTIVDMGIDPSSLGFDSSTEMRNCKVNTLKEKFLEYLKIGTEKGAVIEIAPQYIESLTPVGGLYEVRTVSGNIFLIEKKEYTLLKDYLK